MEFKYDKYMIWMEDESGKKVAEIDFPLWESGVVNITHTIVDKSLGGRGIAGQLTEAAARQMRENGQKAILTCSYAVRWFAKHPEYQDLLQMPSQVK